MEKEEEKLNKFYKINKKNYFIFFKLNIINIKEYKDMKRERELERRIKW